MSEDLNERLMLTEAAMGDLAEQLAQKTMELSMTRAKNSQLVHALGQKEKQIADMAKDNPTGKTDENPER